MKKCCLRALALLAVAAPILVSASEETYRLYDGITMFINNDAGKDFTLTLDVRDINLLEKGPRELLVKVYDPDGKTLWWESDDMKMQCSGTHVRSTQEIGKIKLKRKNIGKGKERIEILLA